MRRGQVVTPDQKLMRALVTRVKAQERMLACYRTGRQPGERVFKALDDTAEAAAEAIAILDQVVLADNAAAKEGPSPELKRDLRSTALVMVRMASDNGQRFDLDEVIAMLGFDRAELEAELDADAIRTESPLVGDDPRDVIRHNLGHIVECEECEDCTRLARYALELFDKL